MKLDKFRRPRSVSIVLVLVLSILGVASLTGPIAVHATAPALVQSAQTGLFCSTSCTTGWNSAVSIGDLLVVHTVCWGPQGATTVSDVASSVWTRIVTAGGANPPQISIWFAFAKGGGSDNIMVTWTNCSSAGNPVGEYTMEEFSGVASTGNTVTTGINQVTCNTSCTDTQSLTVTVSNALVYETFDLFDISGAAACPTITNGGGSQITSQTLLCTNNTPAGVFDVGRTIYSPNRGIGVNSFSMQASAMGANNANGVLHTLLELDPAGGTPSNLGTQTACFGNCGNPAVTLVNTNSTHTVAFNQSIELFYEFQSNLNGQVLNITANVAKTYSNGNSLVLGVYTIPVCSPGQPPFTPICPAALQKSSTIQNPLKGTNSFTNLAIPVSAGQWVGFAFTATFGGMDLNDTNTAVSMNQASDGGGALNPTVSQSTVFSATSKVGLWGFLTGNTITGIPPPPTTGAANCSGILDCILPSLVFSLCSNQTPQCQNASALVWALILSIISLFFVFRGTANVMPGVRIPIGEAFTLALIIWIFVLSGLQLLFVWVPLFFFFIAAVIFGKKTGTFL